MLSSNEALKELRFEYIHFLNGEAHNRSLEATKFRIPCNYKKIVVMTNLSEAKLWFGKENYNRV